jgi:HprK-related kinase A
MVHSDRQHSATDSHCRFKIGEIDLTVRSELSDVQHDFARLYRQYQIPDNPDSEGIRMEVRSSKPSFLSACRYVVHGDGKPLFETCRPSEVFPYLEWGINWRVISRYGQFIQVHAASMAHEGRGLILAGDSGVGKSTLAAALMARGWQYLSDEFALIDPKTHQMHPFPKALCIKSGSFEIIRRLKLPLWRRGDYVKAMKGQVGYVSPSEARSQCITPRCPINVIVFPRYIEGVRPELRPLSRAEAAFSLLRQTFNRPTFGYRAMSVITTITRSAQCFRLESGEIEGTCDLLESILLAHPHTGNSRPMAS